MSYKCYANYFEYINPQAILLNKNYYYCLGFIKRGIERVSREKIAGRGITKIQVCLIPKLKLILVIP
jgi:hypothetical protein